MATHGNPPTFREELFENGPVAGKHSPGEVLEEEVLVLVQERRHIVRHLGNTNKQTNKQTNKKSKVDRRFTSNNSNKTTLIPSIIVIAK